MKRVCACAAIFLVLSCCGTVFGAVAEGQFSVSPMIGGYTYYGNGKHLETAPMYSLRGGYGFTDTIGVEASLDYSITDSTLVAGKKVAIFKYGVEGMYHFMPDANLVPYVALGLGGYNLSGPASLVSRKEMGYMDYGGGVKYFVNDRLALRADVRHILANASAFEYTMGVTIHFGGNKWETKPDTPLAAIKDKLEKMRRKQAETHQIASKNTIVVEIPVQDKVSQEPPASPAVVAPEARRTEEPSSPENIAQQKERQAIEATLAAIRHSHEKIQEQSAPPRIGEQPGSAVDNTNHSGVLEESTQPAYSAPDERKTYELASTEELERLKEAFTKEESERIATFKAGWEQRREARLAAEKAATARMAFDQTEALSERNMIKKWNTSAQAAGQTTQLAKAGIQQKPSLKKNHKKGAKKKHRRSTAR